VFVFCWVTHFKKLYGRPIVDDTYHTHHFIFSFKSRIWSIERRHFQWPWTTPSSHFKVTPLFDTEYLINGTRYTQSQWNTNLHSTHAILKGVISNDLDWFNDEKHRAVYMWQLSFFTSRYDDFQDGSPIPSWTLKMHLVMWLSSSSKCAAVYQISSKSDGFSLGKSDLMIFNMAGFRHVFRVQEWVHWKAHAVLPTGRLNCLVFEKIAFLCTDFGDRQTNG